MILLIRHYIALFVAVSKYSRICVGVMVRPPLMSVTRGCQSQEMKSNESQITANIYSFFQKGTLLYSRVLRFFQFRNMMQAYKDSQASVEKLSAEKREVLGKMQQQRKARLERLSNIKKLNSQRGLFHNYFDYRVNSRF